MIRLDARLLIPALVAAFLIIAPNVELSERLSYYDQKRLLQLGMFAAAAIALLASQAVRRSWLGVFDGLTRGPRWLLALVVAGGLVSAARAPVTAYALSEVGLLVCTIGLAIGIGGGMLQDLERARLRAMQVLALTSGAYLVRYAAGYVAAWFTDVPIFVQELYANFSHLRFFSQFQSWTLPLIVLPAMLLPRGRIRGLAYLLAVAWWTLHFATGSRGTMAALVAALLIVPLAAGGAGRRWLKVQLVCAALGLAAYLIALTLPETMGRYHGMARVVAEGDSQRIRLLAQATASIIQHPWLGIGPQHFAWDYANTAAHPHNALAQWAAEWGLPSTIALLLVVVHGLARWLRRGRELARGEPGSPAALVAAALTGSVVTAGLHSLVSGIIVMPMSQVCLAAVLGWMLAEHQHRLAPGSALPQRGRQLALAVAAVTAVALWLPVAFRDGNGLESRTETYQAWSHRPLRPRFWHQGYIGPAAGPADPVRTARETDEP